MSLPIKTGLPDKLNLPGGYTIRFTAVDPSSGATMTGVKISDVSILAEALGTGTLETGTYLLVPGPENG